ncbi:MAG: universal stress protein [Gammaproteobacteria bacterium]
MKILVAVDFFPQTEQVLEVAKRQAAALGAQLWLIHAAAPGPAFKGYGAGERSDRKQTADEYRQEHRLIQEAAAAARDAGIEATGLLVRGPPATQILKQAEELDADMIVVGTHGFGAAMSLLLGSVSRQVLKKARCPVMVVPAGRPESA